MTEFDKALEELKRSLWAAVEPPLLRLVAFIDDAIDAAREAVYDVRQGFWAAVRSAGRSMVATANRHLDA